MRILELGVTVPWVRIPPSPPRYVDFIDLSRRNLNLTPDLTQLSSVRGTRARFLPSCALQSYVRASAGASRFLPSDVR
jgi:hypothetical protein